MQFSKPVLLMCLAGMLSVIFCSKGGSNDATGTGSGSSSGATVETRSFYMGYTT